MLLQYNNTFCVTVVFKLEPGADPNAGWMVSESSFAQIENGDEGRPRCEQAGG